MGAAMNADHYYGPMAGLPDPERDRQFYEGVPARRLMAWFIDLAVILLVGVPVAVVFGLATFGFGFALFPMVVAVVGFLYRTATIASGSATWGMRFTGIELRRGDGTRFDLPIALAHVAIYTVCFTSVVLQVISCAAIIGTRYGQGLAPQPAAVASVLCHGAAALPLPARQGGAQALHRAPGRRRLPPERRALPPGVPALAERVVPPVLRRLLRVPLGPDRREGLRAVPQPAARAAQQ
jgi:uncharacterized RDD family membrane protein YckC